MKAVIYGKTIEANTLTQIKRLASLEANKRYNVIDEFYLLRIPGVEPIIFIRYNKKTPNNQIIRGEWG